MVFCLNVKGAVLTQIASVIFYVVTLAGCGDLCSNDLLGSVSSPSGRLRAVLFSRECGATVGLNTQVSIIGPTAELTGSGNVVILEGTVPLQLRWRSESELIVVGSGSVKGFKRETVVGDTTIRYE
jgi:hypothetical protein